MFQAFIEMQQYIIQTFRLTKKSLYKTVEFQLLFKIFYITAILYAINFIISIILDAVDLIITSVRLGETFQDNSLISIFDLRFALVVFISLFAVIYIYLIEKNGVVIITTEYYRNNFISFFKTLFISIRRTPLFIVRRFIEMRFVILVFILLFFFWKFLTILNFNPWIMAFFTSGLIIYGSTIFLSILFRYTFTAHITCLEPKESPKEFNENLPPKFLRKRTHVSILFYSVLLLSVLLWILLFYIVIQSFLAIATTLPSIASAATAFFIAFTIISILIVLSVLKTFKVSLMTVLYYEERKRQDKPIIQQTTQKQPKLSKNIHLAILTILFIALAGGAILTTSIKTKTDKIISNAEEYAVQLQEEDFFIDLDEFTIQELIENSLSQENSAIDTIERIVFTYLIFIINK